MEHEKEQKAGFQSTMELMLHQWKDLDSHLQAFLELKGVSLGDSAEKREKTESFASKLRELNERENKILLKVRESELRERKREEVLEKKQKMLDKMILKQKVQERVLAKRENENRSELQGIAKRESELQLEMKRLADLEKALDVKIMMFDMKTENFSEPSQEQDLKSAAKMKGPERDGDFRASDVGSGKNVQEPDSAGKMTERKRSRNGETDLDTQHQASGSVKKVRAVKVNQDQDGLSFSMTMTKTHQTRNFVTMPRSFDAAFDLSGKKRVILNTSEGSFSLDVMQYISPAQKGSRIVVFGCGWNDLYRENRLRIGMLCHFKLKEHTVNGDDSVFSMEVSVDGC